ncbi:DDE-type integrase/transposase/recombinase [Streptomyces griseosporeus]|uniref:DDE-type integrase/transposase/recombinase n=1 Tax=Streptomyces griseosporeus TaxID=1910 RepID=UPI00167DCA66|nr:DDE-type integrase/transposase/recombinase [Streptomyces griseosporeus]GHF35845.1 transposase [Streptomyces griseosporeus]
MTQAVVEVGARLRYGGRAWTLAVLEGARATLVTDEGASAVVLLPYLFADPSFGVEGGPAPGRVPPFGLLEALPVEVRERALAWQRHVREVESGFPDAVGQGAPREQFDPARRSLAQRERAKAEELRAAGWAASAATVRRMRARYRSEGLWGLVDGRAVRERSAVGRADERVVAAIRQVLEGQRERSTGTLVRLRRRVGWLLEEEYGPGVVALPPVSTFNRLVHAVADGQGLLGTAAQRRWHASRPTPPFTPTVALRPGELVMLDSTPLDVLAVLDDGVTGRLELSIALDVATRSICAAVLRPVGTTSVDAAMLLAQMVVPTAMRPGWDAALSMRRSVIPYERLIALDARLEQAAARPVIMPETVVVDQGRVYVSASFVSACESLGISVQPVPPANGPAKGNVERTFRAIADGFSQYLPGHTGSDVSQRGAAAEQDACWSLAQLQELLNEWVICGWQERRHEALRHPMMPHLAVSPNEMWAALVAVTGHVPVPLSADDYVELLPLRWQAVNDYGIRLGYRTYDHPGLNPYRRRRSLRADKNGRWEVHHNPYDPNRVWVRLPGGWLEVPWVHAGAVRRPFTAFTFDHVRRTVERRHGREEHEAAIAQALDALLRRASQGLGSRRERTVAARAQAAAQMTDPSPATAPQQWPAPLTPDASFGLPGSFTAPHEDAGGWDTDDPLDDIEDDPDDDYLLAALADGQDAAAGHTDEASEPAGGTTREKAAEQTLDAAGADGMRIYDPYQEAQAW